MSEKVTIAIPARMASSRLPGKMLALLGGKPVLQHVIERVKRKRFMWSPTARKLFAWRNRLMYTV